MDLSTAPEGVNVPDDLRRAVAASLPPGAPVSILEAGCGSASQLDLGLSLQNPCPFGPQVFAPSGGFSGSEVGRCRLPVTSQSSEHSQDVIHQKPVVLTAKGEQRWIEPRRTLVVTQR